ncbi:MAG: glycosyltransferase [Bryobacterales bacterium]|nr:glycosyltransferase [Bryobacterales bacterium]
MSSPASKPLLSVVVTVVDGGDVLRRFLRALTTQEDPPAMEILVPFDSSKAGVAQVCAEFPTVTPVPMGEVPTFRPITTAAGQHEMFDRQRVAGLNRAIGELIAILEDRAPPRPNWVRTAVRLHREHPYGVIGGAIEPAPSASSTGPSTSATSPAMACRSPASPAPGSATSTSATSAP